MAKKIAIIAEHKKGRVKPITYELLTLALKIHELDQLTDQAASTGACEISFIIMGENIKRPVKRLSEHTGHDIYAVCIPGCLQYHGSLYKKILSKLLTENKFDYILAPHSSSGMDYAPALSIDLKGSCITGVEDVQKKDKNIYFIRSLFRGKLSARLIPKSFPLIITLQPGSLKPFFPDKNRVKNPEKKSGIKQKTIIKKIVYEDSENKMVFSGTRASPSEGSDLAKADIIVSGGRGIEEEENYKYIEMLAGLFPRAATGGSRPVCDYGWVNYSKQVGVTGTTISPKLYIACGISGASQHVEGIRDARFIVAINTDPDAPIFQVADVCIEEDLIEFIPLFVTEVKKRMT